VRSTAPEESNRKERINGEIRASSVRLIGPEGEQIGIVKLIDALRAAEAAEMDLVEIAAQAEPPVCRVMDYGKFQFQLQKKAAEAKKKQKQIQIKELKFRPGTEEGDYQVKLRNLKRFLEEGDRIKVIVWFRGREIAHKELGLKVLERIQVDIEGLGVIDQLPKLEGRQLMMMVIPSKSN
jgi:translation initiation factor IF-3